MKRNTLAFFLLLTPLCLTTSVNAENLQQVKRLIETPEKSLKQLSEVASLIQTGIQQRRLGNYQQSIATLEKALQLAQQSKDLDGEWQARTFLALTYKLSGNLPKAAELHEQNLAFLRQHPNELAGEPMNRERDSIEALSGVYTSLGNYAKAIELLKLNLASLSAKDNNPGSLGKAKTLEKLGVNLLLAGDVKEAEKNLLAALEAYERALNLRLDAGSPSLSEYESQVAVMRWLQQILVAQNRTDEALELAEKGRSRAFVALLASRLANNPKLQPEIALPNLDRIKQIAKEQNSTLVEYTVTYKYDPDLPLEFSNYQDIPATGLLIWVIKPTGEIAFRKVNFEVKDSELGTLVESARESIGARGRGIQVAQRLESESQSLNNEKLQQLHQLLIQPIADLLPKNPTERVTFIPQDLLFLVPFVALQDSAGKYLLEKHTILTAPSIQVLDLTHQQQQRIQDSVKSVLVVGNPTMPVFIPQDGSSPQQLPSLPGAEKEAIAIAQLFNSQAITGNAATQQAVLQRLSQARIIHLATHGIFDNVQGFFSSLALAPSEQNKGFLTAREVMSLKLNAELVVLSACDTGKGKITGDGVVGLSRSFISAGTPSVIVSLWSVADGATSELMTAFYHNLKGGMDKAQALRNAMLETMKQHPKPRDWAAFTLIGEADTSKTLASASGVVPVGNGNTIQATASRYTVFPLPDIVSNYTEFPSQFVKGEVDVSFTTTLSVPELVNFYRQAFTQKGLTEDTALSRQDPQSFQLAFKGSPNNRIIVIQGLDFSKTGYNNRTVSIRFEN